MDAKVVHIGRETLRRYKASGDPQVGNAWLMKCRGFVTVEMCYMGEIVTCLRCIGSMEKNEWLPRTRL